MLLGLAVWAIAKFPGRENRALLQADMYLFCAFLIGIGVILGTVLSQREIAATFIALLLAVPQLFTDRPYRMIVLIVLSVGTFILVALQVKDPVTWSSDITNAIVFGLMSIVLSIYAMSTRIIRFRLENQNRLLTENDQLTGALNRSKYEQALLSNPIPDAKNLFCVYVDVNGLHEMNNTEGHEAGDRMLQYIAAVMKHVFSNDLIYRIGGDEFVVLGADRDKTWINEHVRDMKDAIVAARYHVAVGVSRQDRNDRGVSALICEAEKDMYADKSRYYRTSGVDRRRRRDDALEG